MSTVQFFSFARFKMVFPATAPQQITMQDAPHSIAQICAS